MKELMKAESLTMSSLEIAELTGKEHKNVLADIRNMLKDLYGEGGELKFQSSYKSSQNKRLVKFNLDREHTDCLLTGYSAKLRMAVIKRWKELEATNVPKLPDFTNPAEAARAWAIEYEKRQAAEAENAKLNTIIDNEFGYSSILRAATYAGVHEKTFNWRPLKAYTLNSLKMEVKRVPSPRYGYQNLYPIRAFEFCYPDIDFDDLKPELVEDKAKLALRSQPC